MSIREVIKHRVDESRLFPIEHRLGFVSARQFYASPEVNELINGPWETKEWKTRCFSLQGTIDNFIGGGLKMAVALPSNKKYERKPNANLRLLHPWRDEVWEIRDVHPDPALSLRIFGRFAATDLFVALGWKARDVLAEPNSRAWRDARISCKTSWNNLLHPYQPITGTQIHDYISTDVVLI